MIFSLACWINRIEEAITMYVPGGFTVKLNSDELLRADTATRMKNYEIGLRNKIYTINEVRAMEGLPPIEGGDDLNNNNVIPLFGAPPAGEESDASKKPDASDKVAS
jgi:phage portal protein BeeE